MWVQKSFYSWTKVGSVSRLWINGPFPLQVSNRYQGPPIIGPIENNNNEKALITTLDQTKNDNYISDGNFAWNPDSSAIHHITLHIQVISSPRQPR